MRKDDQLDIVLTCGERPADTLIVSGPLRLWARLLDTLGGAHADTALRPTGSDGEASPRTAESA